MSADAGGAGPRGTDPRSTAPAVTAPLVTDELEVLGALVPLRAQHIIELGCGAARLARTLLEREPATRLTGLEVDPVQHARNLAEPHPRLQFVAAGAEAIPFPDASFDGALMLKSLHHVPLEAMAAALREVARVLRPGGWLYVSEPVYAGAFNEIVRLYNDERIARAAAQQALDEALRTGPWDDGGERRFGAPSKFRDFAEFEARIVRASFARHVPDEALLARVRSAFEQQLGPDGARFVQPMLVRVLRRRAAPPTPSPLHRPGHPA
ncbi:MAG: class I SAM-dependent methyltransferase [Steroidobacteraceae bacterium]